MSNALAKVASNNGWMVMPDTDQYINRIQIAGSKGNLYIVSYRKATNQWCCECLGWRRHRHCKHLDAMVPTLEAALSSAKKEIA